MNTRNSRLPTALLAASFAALVTPPVLAGDPEHFCTAGTPYTEAWPPGTQVQWELCHGQATLQSVAPGFPRMIDNSQPGMVFCPYAPSLSDHPGFQSLTRAIDAWNSACTPGGRCTTFSLATLPNQYQPAGGPGPCPAGTILNPWDTFNRVSLFEPLSTFGGVGFEFVLAITVVTTNVTWTSGVITDADIAFQALGDCSTQNWSFVEENAALGMTFATTLSGLPPQPALGYVDLQGAAMHEFGHFAGLGHSMVDSTAASNGTQFPTMFDTAQVEPFKTTVRLPPAAVNCSVSSTFSTWPQFLADGTNTIVGGILGRSARDLTDDDEHAIVNGYSGVSSPTFGSVSGIVYNDSFTTQPGAHVVLFRDGQIDKTAVGTFAYTNGAFRFDGLLPGTYYMYTEWPEIDRTGVGGPSNGFYWLTGGVPNFIFPVFAPGFGCVASLPNGTFYQYEFFDNAEPSFSERAMTASPILVTAGANQVADIACPLRSQAFDPDTLRVRDDLLTTPRWSSRGVRLERSTSTTTLPRSVTFRAEAPSGVFDGDVVTLYLDYARNPVIDNGQMRLVTGAASVTAIPGQRVGVVSGGFAEFQVTIRRADALRNVFAQAVFADSIGGGMTQNIWTNPVNVWVASP
jgi:hypothetical protein